MARQKPTDFPVRCDLPVEGENLSYVLYGSGGCSLYDTAKLRALGGIDEVYEPAYVEDLDAAYADLQARGARFVMPPTTQAAEGIRLAVCLDPDGLAISFAQPLERPA